MNLKQAKKELLKDKEFRKEYYRPIKVWHRIKYKIYWQLTKLWDWLSMKDANWKLQEFVDCLRDALWEQCFSMADDGTCKCNLKESR